MRKVERCNVPGLSSDPSRHREYRQGEGGCGGDKEDTLIQSYTNLQKTPSFILVQSVFYKAHTVGAHRCIENLRMKRVDNDFLVCL